MEWRDEIVAEVRRAREEYAAKFNYDLDAIIADLRRKQFEHAGKIVSRPPKPVCRPVVAARAKPNR
jgi:hypothetical protein